MKDIVERLRLLADTAHRDPSFVGETLDTFSPVYREAADEIERLRAICDAYEQTGPWRLP